MSTVSYIIDSVLVVIVLLQVRERPLTNRQLIRPIVIVAFAVINYLHGIPAAGNDLVLVGALALLGGLIGSMAGVTTLMRRGADGRVLSHTGWTSGFFWVLGMGARFAFLIWFTHSGAHTIVSFSAHHSITSNEAWTVALLAMAVFEVVGRTVVLAARRRRLAPPSPLQPA